MFTENFSQMFTENFSQMFTDLFADSRRKNQRKSACFQSAIISESMSRPKIGLHFKTVNFFRDKKSNIIMNR